MRVPWMLWCVLCAWVCYGMPQPEQRDQNNQNNGAKECELYGTQGEAPPTMQFQRRVSVGIRPQDKTSSAKLVMQSATTGKKCQLFFISGTITVVCGRGNMLRQESLSQGDDDTELWLEVTEGSEGALIPAWDLKVVMRQGNNRRAHLLIPDTGLQPPVNLHLNSTENLQYYFNCITGCLFEKSVEMPPGDHTFFLRHDEGFVQMTLDCGLTDYSMGNVSVNGMEAELDPTGHPKVDHYMKKLSINVTAAELGPAGGIKKVQVVWSIQLGDIRVLVDGVPVGNLIEYEPMKKERQVKVKVAEEGGGMVAPCDPDFQLVACGDDEQVPATTTTTTTTTDNTSPTTCEPPPPPPPCQASPYTQQPSTSSLPAVLTFVILNFIVTVVAVSLAIVFYCRSSSNTCSFSAKGKSAATAIFSKRTSTSSSTRSSIRVSQRSSQRNSQRNSQRRKSKSLNDATHETPPETLTEEMRASAETVTTPLNTHGSHVNPRLQKQLSTDEFVNLRLI